MGALGEPTGDIYGGTAAGVEERTSIWPHVEQELLDLIRDHKSTIVFANSRRLSERLCSRLNELAEEEVARAHHGSVAREQRLLIEEDLKAGRLPAVVATSSLELGIDMGAVDLVVQVEAPDSVASGLQRVGRAGHHVGSVSRGIFFPKYRGDLVESAVVVERMREGAIEETHYPRNPLDVLGQQIVAMTAMDEWDVDELEAIVKRAAPFHDLPRSAFESVLDMLSGRYPSDEFAELRPRINWDRATNKLTGRRNAQRLAVTSGGTIPDRGLFGVFLAGEKGQRVGELDEEMVYESRPGDTFVLGASTWMIEDITHDRVIVTPAPGKPGRMPFWHGDSLGRPLELGTALGEFIRTLQQQDDDDKKARLTDGGSRRTGDRQPPPVPQGAEGRDRLVARRQDDRRRAFPRRAGRLAHLRALGLRGAGPRALVAGRSRPRMSERLGMNVQCMYTDDGIVVRVLDTDEPPPTDAIFLEPEEVDDAVVSQVGNSALFASRFRECAARALLLPKRRPGQRTPLWQQRQKSAQLLQVASKYGSFPIMLETFRECLQDVFDVPALTELMGRIRSREVRIVEVETPVPSPFASSLQFSYVAAFMYEGDAPIAERRAQALSLDRSLLAEIMGHEELRELLDESSLAELELELQLLTDNKKARDADALHDALRYVGDLNVAEAQARSRDPDRVEEWFKELEDSNQALSLRIAGEERWIAVEDASRYPRRTGSGHTDRRPDRVSASRSRTPWGTWLLATRAPTDRLSPRTPATRLGLGVAVVKKRSWAVGDRGPSRRGRVPSGSLRSGIYRRRGTATSPPHVARGLPQGDRTGAARGAGALLAGMARDRRGRAPRCKRRIGSRGRRATAGDAASGLGTRASDPCGAPSRLSALSARPARVVG